MVVIKKYVVQARIDENDKERLEEIRSIIAFEKMKGVDLTPGHPYSKNSDRITDTDVIRFLINNFKFMD